MYLKNWGQINFLQCVLNVLEFYEYFSVFFNQGVIYLWLEKNIPAIYLLHKI